MPHIILLGTLDTKRTEVLYLYNQLKEAASGSSNPLEITLIDCGRQAITDDAITIGHTDLVARYALGDSAGLLGMPRGQVIEFLITCVSKCVRGLLRTNDIHGIVGIGGSGGTSLISAVMRTAAPIGLPKLIVSTVASGNTGPIVGECDITLMYSIVDIAGSNRILREILGNAAGAIFGMASKYEHQQVHNQALRCVQQSAENTRVGITMFGVTTRCVDFVRRHLEEKYSAEVYVFHATGHGGKAMERFVEEGRLDAILDITTTEICDFIAGGTMRCDTSRLEATLKRGIPNIISVGATDMVNFGPLDTVPQRYRDRNLQVHNPSVTLMRTSPDDCQEVGNFILDKVNRFSHEPKMVEIWLPKGGVSSMATAGGPFADAKADAILADLLSSGLTGKGARVISDDRDINDHGFAIDIADRLMDLVAEFSHNLQAS